MKPDNKKAGCLKDFTSSDSIENKELIFVGFFLIVLGLSANEYLLAKLFSQDGIITLSAKYIIRVFDALCLVMGLLFIMVKSVRNLVIDISKEKILKSEESNKWSIRLTRLFNTAESSYIYIPVWLIILSIILSVFYALWEVNKFIQINWDEHTFWYTYNDVFLKLFFDSGNFPQWNPYIQSGVSLHGNTPFPLSLSCLLTLLFKDAVLGLLFSQTLFLAIGVFFLLAWLKNFGLKSISTLAVLFLFYEYHLQNNSFEGLATIAAIVITYASLLFVKKHKFYVIGLASIFLGFVLTEFTPQGTFTIFLLQLIFIFFLRKKINWRFHLSSVLMIWTFGVLMAFPTLVPMLADVQKSQKILCPDYVNPTLSANFIKNILWYLYHAYGFQLSSGMIIPLVFGLGMPFIYWNRFSDFTRDFLKAIYAFIFIITVFYLSQGYLAHIPLVGKTLAAYNKMRPAMVTHFGVLILIGICIDKWFARNIAYPKIGWRILLLVFTFVILFFTQNFYVLEKGSLKFGLMTGLILLPFILILAVVYLKTQFLRNAIMVIILGIFIFLWMNTGARYYTQSLPEKFIFFPTFKQAEISIFPDEDPDVASRMVKFLQKNTKQDFSETTELRGIGRNFGRDPKGLIQKYPSLQIPTIHGFSSLRSLRAHHLYLWMLDDVRINNPSAFDFLYKWGGFVYDYGSRYDTELLNLAGVKYLIANKTFNDNRFNIVLEGQKNRIFENKAAFPRAFLVSSVRLFDSVEQMGEYLRNAPSTVLKNEAVFLKADIKNIEGGLATVESLSGNKGEMNAKIIKFLPNDVFVEVNSDQPSMLILTQTYHHGWQVSINGVPSKVYPAYYAYLGVMVPEGKSIVKFTFNDKNFVNGAYIAIVSFSILVIIMIISLILPC